MPPNHEQSQEISDNIFGSPPTEREKHLEFLLTHCAVTVAEDLGRPTERLYRCALKESGHQGDHHRVGDSHMQEVAASWGEFLSWREAYS